MVKTFWNNEGLRGSFDPYLLPEQENEAKELFETLVDVDVSVSSNILYDFILVK